MTHYSALHVLAAQGPEQAGGAWPWLNAGLFVVLTAILVALLLVLVEVRRLATEWRAFAKVARDRTEPLAKHAASAARNLDRVCQVARKGADRLDRSLGRFAEDVDNAADNVRTRLNNMSALADFAQSEAEEAVLDAAAKLRVLRRGAGLAGWLARSGRDSPGPDADAPQETADPAEVDDPVPRLEPAPSPEGASSAAASGGRRLDEAAEAATPGGAAAPGETAAPGNETTPRDETAPPESAAVSGHT